MTEFVAYDLAYVTAYVTAVLPFHVLIVPMLCIADKQMNQIQNAIFSLSKILVIYEILR